MDRWASDPGVIPPANVRQPSGLNIGRVTPETVTVGMRSDLTDRMDQCQRFGQSDVLVGGHGDGHRRAEIQRLNAGSDRRQSACHLISVGEIENSDFTWGKAFDERRFLGAVRTCDDIEEMHFNRLRMSVQPRLQSSASPDEMIALARTHNHLTIVKHGMPTSHAL